MVPTELKNDLHRMVDETNDPLILKEIAALFAALREEGGDWWDLISEEEKEKIELGRAQAAAGQTVPHEVVRAKAQRIIGKKVSGNEQG
jgi:predicted transcriptional regulator